MCVPNKLDISNAGYLNPRRKFPYFNVEVQTSRRRGKKKVQGIVDGDFWMPILATDPKASSLSFSFSVFLARTAYHHHHHINTPLHHRHRVRHHVIWHRFPDPPAAAALSTWHLLQHPSTKPCRVLRRSSCLCASIFLATNFSSNTSEGILGRGRQRQFCMRCFELRRKFADWYCRCGCPVIMCYELGRCDRNRGK